jgi:hypothetical protein
MNGQFQGKDPLNDRIDNRKIDTNSYRCPVTISKEADLSFITSNGTDCVLPFSILNRATSKQFTLEILFRGNDFSYVTVPVPASRILFKFDIIQLSTTVLRNNKEELEHLVIKLDGLSAPSYSSLADGEWHFMVIRADVNSGLRQVLVDGQEYDAMTKTVEPADSFVFGSFDAFRGFHDIGYLAIYNTIVSDEKAMSDLQRFSKSIKAFSDNVELKTKKVGKKNIVYDPLEFAPANTIPTIQQLKEFPLPRIDPKVSLFRNVSWFDITYFARQPWNLKPKKTDISANAVSISDELSKNWNYYIEIPTTRGDSIAASKVYNSDETIEGSLVRYANEHPEIPVSTITFQAQIKPSHYGFDSNVPFIISQKLPDNYYLTDASGKPVIHQGKKWISPLAPLDFATWDGITAGSYVRQLNRVLKNSVTLISENGELFGHSRSADLLNADPSVRKLIEKKQLSIVDFNGWFQYRLDSTYKDALLKHSSSRNAYYTVYEVMAASSNYWPAYKKRIFTNSLFNNKARSTPSFYPSTPSNWRTSSGPNLGYGAVAEGRLKEINVGVNYFAPFVAAGWGKEEANIRPAQWLALLKAMIVLGADFFHVGYFNVTDANGKWPDGKGPNDPRGYAYQLVMPTYAQALISLVPDIFYKGTPINPGSKQSFHEFRFPGNNENELILVRKYGRKYLIYGSIQPSSNNKGSIPSTSKTHIQLEGHNISFMIRRQGSMYVLDLESSKPIFYQLDLWHQYEHPYYWTKEINIQAEIYSDNQFATIKTEETAGDFDFSKFLSYVFVKKDGMVSYRIPSRKSCSYQLKLIARSKRKSTLTYTVGRLTFQTKSLGNAWKTIDGGKVTLNGTGDDIFKVKANDDVDIDSIQFIPVQ